MASFFGANYANTILEDLFDGAYIGLCTDDTEPTAAGGNITEPSGNNYSRREASYGAFTASGGTIANTAYLYFDEATASWGNIKYIIVCDAATGTGDHVRYVGELSSSITVNANTVPLFRPGNFSVTITAVTPSQSA